MSYVAKDLTAMRDKMTHKLVRSLLPEKEKRSQKSNFDWQIRENAFIYVRFVDMDFLENVDNEIPYILHCIL